MILKVINFIKRKKIVSGLIVLILIVAGFYGYKAYKGTPVEVHYVVGVVEKGTLITSVSGSGQIAVSNQVDVKARASGDVSYVRITEGQEVKAGTVLAGLDAKDALKSVRDAASNLESAKISLSKLKQSADALSVLQAENSLIQSKESKQNTEDDLKKTYDDGFNTIANTFIDLPTLITGLHDLLYNYTLVPNQTNIDYYSNVQMYDSKAIQYKDDAESAYKIARAAYDANFADYKSTNRYADTDTISSLIDDTYETTKNIAEAIKSANNLIQFYEDKLSEHNLKPLALADTHITTLNGYTGKTNTHLDNLLSIHNTIQTDEQNLLSADRSIAEKTESLAKLKAGTDPLDIQSQELAIKQRQNVLVDAQEKLADYTIRAPFDSVVAKVSVKKSDSASSGTVIATLISKQKLAQISLNEVDVAKIKVGQKATLTFDAIDGLNITGEVAEIDALGTVSQGVVTYTVQIVFDTQDDRVKSGMSVSSAIITNLKQDALIVPSSAVKMQGDVNYVEMLDTVVDEKQIGTSAMKNTGVISLTPPKEQQVEIGLSNDTSTEIISGVKEGDQIVTRTITSTTQKTSTQQAPSLFGAAGGNKGNSGAGAIRSVGR